MIDSLKILKPVVVGHSMAGSEITYLGQKHSKDLGGLVYLDANGDAMDWPWSDEEYRTLGMKSMKTKPAPPGRTANDNQSVATYRAWQKRSGMFPFPPGEVRSMYEVEPDGAVGKLRMPGFVSRAVDAGSIARDYRGITVPVLALFPVPLPRDEKWKQREPVNEQERLDSDRIDEIFLGFIRRWQGNLKAAVPGARIIELPGGYSPLALQV